jgi:3-oxoadipate enol-lactonase
MRATIRLAPPAEQQAQLDAWLARPSNGGRVVVAESGFVPLNAPDDVPLARLAPGCVCCIGQVTLRVTLARMVRLHRPREVLLLVATPDHLPRVRALLADGSLGVRFEEDSTMESIERNGVRLAYRIDGSTDPRQPWLVLGHSLACDHTMWDPQIAALRDFRILRFDTRGHGKSDAPAGDYTLEMLADDLKTLLDALSIQHCHYVGLSMGGMIGQQFLLRYPDRFATVTLADTTSRYPTEARGVWEERLALVRSRGMDAIVPSTLERWFTPAFRARCPDEVARIGHLIRSTPVAGYAGCAAAVSRINLTARLGDIDTRALVIVGDADIGTPRSMAEDIVQALPGSRLHVIEHAAHLSNVEQPAEFNRVLRQFLAAQG